MISYTCLSERLENIEDGAGHIDKTIPLQDDPTINQIENRTPQKGMKNGKK